MSVAIELAPRAAVYVRISRDDEDRGGAGLGVKRQERDARKLAERRGWQIAEIYVDNDVSAYSGRRRPAYERLLADVEAGHVDVVLAWHPDRLHRSPLELEAFIDLLERGNVAVETVQAGRIDLATPAGRMQARTLGNVARYESEHRAERIRSKHRELAENGKLSGGGRRPFGFEPDRRTHRLAEAELIREAARRVLGGESLWAITRDWTERGVATSTGAPWSTTAIKSFLLAPRTAGLRQLRDVTAKAVWDPILDETTWKRVGAILTDPARKRQRATRRYLLAGVVRCGRCGVLMTSAPRQRSTGGGKRGVKIRHKGEPTQRAYGCPVQSRGGCGGVFILADEVERFVSDAVRYRLRGNRLARARARLAKGSDGGLTSQIEADEALLAELGRDYADRKIGRQAFHAAAARTQAHIDEARRLLAARDRPDVLRGLGDIDAEWDGLGLERQRAIIEALLADVRIHPATGPRSRFDPNRIEFGKWRA
jgi:site-specific DNA recombinase